MENKAFENLPVSPLILRSIADAGYTEMTDIQHKIIPLILEGRDVIGQSSTGTGKTAAFGIPAVEMIDTDEELSDPQVLVLCPTRELAIQVSEELRKFSKYKEGVRIVTVYGGQNIDTQIRALKRSAIVVGTPGRVIDHLKRRTLKLGSIKMVVLDEADEMLDMGFLDDIRHILYNVPEQRQTVLFSATMPSSILRITQRFQKNPEHIHGDDGQVAFDLITQYYCEVPHNKKAQSVRLLFHQEKATHGLIFCNTKRMVDLLTRELSDMGVSVAGLHGDMRQSSRTDIMKRFKEGTIDLLVATDVAARGIDASGVDIIINYDIPEDMEYYVHRIGRTGRAGKQGVAITLIAGHGELFSLCDIEDVTHIQLKPYFLEGLEAAPEDKHVSHSAPRSDRGDRRDRDHGRSREGSSRRSDRGDKSDSLTRRSDSALISVDVGSNHDVNQRHIASSIMKHARLKKEQIGKITVREEESFIELDPEVARHVMKSMQDATINDFVVVFKAVTPQPQKSNSGNHHRRRNRKPHAKA